MEETNFSNIINLEEEFMKEAMYTGNEDLPAVHYQGVKEKDIEENEDYDNLVTKRKASSDLIHFGNKEEVEYTRDEEFKINDEDNNQLEINILTIEKDEFKYLGQVKNDLREGFGVCYYINGDIYKGQWVNDKREGLGKMIFSDGEIWQGELKEDKFEGYCECIKNHKKYSIEGYYFNNNFIDYIVVKNDNKIFEGEVTTTSNISIGKLINSKKPSKVFFGEVLNYKEEYGLGIFLNKNKYMYLGQIKNKIFQNYIEMYNKDGQSYFVFLRDGFKEGYCFSFSKDNRVCFGKYNNNYKNGPFFTFSNSLDLPKSNARMEIFHYDFKSKVVDKLENSRKYLQLNYPEFTNILNLNYSELISKFNMNIFEETGYFQQINAEFTDYEVKAEN